MLYKKLLNCIFAISTLNVGNGVAFAQIDPGFDLFNVIDGSTFIELDPLFPGAGTVFSDGVHFPELGNFSTGLRRIEGLPSLAIGQTEMVAIEFFAEHSTSLEPVDRSAFGLGEGLADLHSVINRGGVFSHLPNTDGLVSPSLGFMTITRTVADGGTFEINLDINPLYVLTTVGGDISDLNGPDVLLTLDGTGLLNPVGSIGGEWSFIPPPNAIESTEFPTGGFYASAGSSNGLPVSTFLTSGNVVASRSITVAQVPEPLTILGTGTAIAFGTGFKRKLAKSKKK